MRLYYDSYVRIVPRVMKTIPLFFIFLFVSTGIHVYAQDDYRKIIRDTISIPQKIKKVDSLLQKKYAANELKEYDILLERYSVWLYRKKKYPKAIATILSSIENHTGDATNLQKKQSLAGLFYFNNKEYLKSNLRYENAIAIDNSTIGASGAYTGIGRNYFYTGDSDLSVKYYQAGLQLAKQFKDYPTIIRNIINSSNAYLEIGNARTLKILNENLSFSDSIPKKHFRKSSLTKLEAIKARYYTHYKIKDSTQEKGKRLLKAIISKATKEKDSLTLFYSYSDLGILLNKKDIPNSTNSYLKSISYCPSRFLVHNIYNYGNLAKNYAFDKQFDQALNYLNKAIAIASGAEQSIFDVNISTLENLDNLRDGVWIIFEVAAEMHLLKFQSSKNEKDLEYAIALFRNVDRLLDYYTLNSTELGSKLEWRKKASEIYARALKACYLKQDIENANFFMEKNKALLLSSEIEKQQNKQSLAFPKEVYENEVLIQKRLIELEKELKKQPNDTHLAKEILLVKKNIKEYQDSVKQIFPKYLIAKKTNIVSIYDIQNKLSEDEINIHFHISEDDGYGVYSNANNGYILVITPEKIIFEEIKNLKKLKAATRELSKALKSPFRNQEDIDRYTRWSLGIYNQLFISEEIKALLHSKKVTIIPDNYISLIPFEALMTSNEPSSYLIKQTEISYTFSNSFQVNNSRINPNTYKILGMAPIEFEPLNLSTLNYSAAELDKVETHFRGDYYIGEAATKQQFLETANQYDLIHLVTHADAKEGASPWIAFSDQKLELEDLYVSSNKASLVFLSGCNTTLGEQAAGEGVMSLARGFFFAGSQSVISTLWSIDDKSSAEITNYFYENITSGEKKSTALHNAKLSYLKNHSLSESSPYYWASFVLNGTNNSINTSNSLFYSMPLIVCSLLLLGLLILKLKNH